MVPVEGRCFRLYCHLQMMSLCRAILCRTAHNNTISLNLLSHIHMLAASVLDRTACLSPLSLFSLSPSLCFSPPMSLHVSLLLSFPCVSNVPFFLSPCKSNVQNYKSSFLPPEHQAWKKYQSNSLNLIIYVAFFFEQKVYLLHTQQLHSSEVVLDNEGLLCRSQLPVLLFDYSKKH